MAAAAPAIMTAVKVIGTGLAVMNVVKGIKEGNILQAVLGGVGAFAGLSSLGALGASAGTTVGNTAAGTAAKGMADAAANGGIAAEGSNVIANTAQTAAEVANTANSGAGFLPDVIAEAQGLSNVGSTSTTAMDMLAAQDAAFNGGSGLMSETSGALASNSGFAAPQTAMDMLGSQDAAFSGGSGMMPETSSALASNSGAAGGFQLKSLADAIGAPIDFIKNNPEMMKVAGSMLQGWQKEKLLKQMWDKQQQLQDEQRGRMGYMQNMGSYVPNFA